MDSAMAASMQGAPAASGPVPGASAPQVPLSFMKRGEAATITKVRGKAELHHHLENLGFVEGALVKVVSEAAGDLIVEVKGTQVALNRQVATHIIATTAA